MAAKPEQVESSTPAETVSAGSSSNTDAPPAPGPVPPGEAGEESSPTPEEPTSDRPSGEGASYTDLYVALSRAAWAASRAREQHGDESPEYRAAKAETDAARERLRAAATCDWEDCGHPMADHDSTGCEVDGCDCGRPGLDGAAVYDLDQDEEGPAPGPDDEVGSWGESPTEVRRAAAPPARAQEEAPPAVVSSDEWTKRATEFVGRKTQTAKGGNGGWCALGDKAIEDGQLYKPGAKKGRRAHTSCAQQATAGRAPTCPTGTEGGEAA